MGNTCFGARARPGASAADGNKVSARVSVVVSSREQRRMPFEEGARAKRVRVAATEVNRGRVGKQGVYLSTSRA
eukprot:552957-Pleurochrysis_carterae.AAC.2